MGYIETVPRYVLRADEIESSIAVLERRVLPVARLIADLESPYNLSHERREMLDILRLRYLHQNTWERTIEYMKISGNTFGKRRKQLVELAACYLEVERF
jgi:hypothetical protein